MRDTLTVGDINNGKHLRGTHEKREALRATRDTFMNRGTCEKRDT